MTILYHLVVETRHQHIDSKLKVWPAVSMVLRQHLVSNGIAWLSPQDQASRCRRSDYVTP